MRYLYIPLLVNDLIVAEGVFVEGGAQKCGTGEEDEVKSMRGGAE